MFFRKPRSTRIVYLNISLFRIVFTQYNINFGNSYIYWFVSVCFTLIPKLFRYEIENDALTQFSPNVWHFIQRFAFELFNRPEIQIARHSFIILTCAAISK